MKRTPNRPCNANAVGRRDRDGQRKPEHRGPPHCRRRLHAQIRFSPEKEGEDLTSEAVRSRFAVRTHSFLSVLTRWGQASSQRQQADRWARRDQRTTTTLVPKPTR